MLDTYDEVADLLRKAESVLFITGAGISADSGLPTYRGVGGLYDGVATDEGLTIEEVLSGPVFELKPELTWKYLWQVGEARQGAEPNRGHEVMAEIEQIKKCVWVMTQNVDGLHRIAGTQNLIEVHGALGKLLCTRCGYDCDSDEILAVHDEPPLPPLCVECGHVLRPDVVLFEEMLSDLTLRQLNHLDQEDVDLVFSVGTSSIFPYITHPVYSAKFTGVPTVEINPVETSISRTFDFRFASGAAATLDKLWSLAQSRPTL